MSSQQENLRAIVNRDGAAILNITAGTISTLNGTGAIVWQALERGDDVGSIVKQLVRETGADIGTVREDVAYFVQSLRKQNLFPG